MKIYIYIVLLGFSFLSSCYDTSKNEQEKEAVIDTISVHSDKKIISSIGETLLPKSRRVVANWEEYKLIDELLSRFLAISNNEALHNADELNTLSKQLRDSIRIQKLKDDPTFKVRLNVLYSETLRLKDMNDIPVIKPEEVSNKIKDVLNAFFAVNAKINSIYAVDNLEKQLSLDPSFKDMLQNEDKTESEAVLESKSEYNPYIEKGRREKPKFLTKGKQKTRRKNPSIRDRQRMKLTKSLLGKKNSRSLPKPKIEK